MFKKTLKVINDSYRTQISRGKGKNAKDAF